MKDLGSPRLDGGALTPPFNHHGFLTNFLRSCSCKRRFQVATDELNTTGINDVVGTVLAVPDHERDLILNVYLKQDRSTTRYACYWIYMPWEKKGRKQGATLLEIMQQQISSPNYAFLFAGQTSIGDEEVSDEAIRLAGTRLAAGYCGIWKKSVVPKISMGPRFDVTTSGGTSSSCEVDESEDDGGSVP